MRRRVKSAITRVGERCSGSTLHRLNAVVNYLEAGSWMRSHGFAAPERVDRREQLFDLIARDIRDRDVLYMEFGVFEGASMRYWSKLLRSPRSHLHGFDSFEGLPQRWMGQQRGEFSTGGEPPQIEDERVRFFVGWFEETLPTYDAPPHEQFVLMIDSDLYASAAYVLQTLEPLIVPGAYVYFDEFQDRAGELRAFEEFLERTSMRFRLVGASHELAHVAFQRLS